MAKTQLLQGTLDLLILRVLALGPLHGLGIADRIAEVTRDALRIKAGSLFPALYRLEAETVHAHQRGSQAAGGRKEIMGPSGARRATGVGDVGHSDVGLFESTCLDSVDTRP